MTDYVGSAGAGRLAELLRGITAEVRREERPALRKAGQIVRDTAAQKAAWSARIPRSLSVVTSMSMSRSAVAITARRAVAPHARPLEGIAGNASFRHPVYGTRTRWVSQACRPFLRPAVLQEQERVTAALVEPLTRGLARL